MTDTATLKYFTMSNSVVVSDINIGAVIGYVGTSPINMNNCYLINTKGYVASLNKNLDAAAQEALHLPSTNTAYSYANFVPLLDFLGDKFLRVGCFCGGR